MVGTSNLAVYIQYIYIYTHIHTIYIYIYTYILYTSTVYVHISALDMRCKSWSIPCITELKAVNWAQDSAKKTWVNLVYRYRYIYIYRTIDITIDIELYRYIYIYKLYNYIYSLYLCIHICIHIYVYIDITWKELLNCWLVSTLLNQRISIRMVAAPFTVAYFSSRDPIQTTSSCWHAHSN